MQQPPNNAWQDPLRFVVAACLGVAAFLTPWSHFWIFGVYAPDLPKAVALLFAIPLVFVWMPSLLSPRSPAFWAMLLTGWTVFRALDTVYWAAALTNGKDMALTGLVFIVVSTIGLRERSMRFLTICLAAGSAVSVTMMLLGVEGRGGVEFLKDTDRLSVEGFNANFVAYCCASAAALVASLWMSRDRRRITGFLAKLLYASTIAYLSLGVLLPATRGGAVAFAAVLAVLLLGQITGKSLTGILIAITGVVAVIALVMMVPTIVERFSGYGGSHWDNGRWRVWAEAWRISQERPFFGVGTGQFPYVSTIGIGAHNGVLSLLAELGAPGLALFAMVILTILAKVRAAHKWRIALPILAGWLPIFMTGVWERSFIGWTGLALIVAACNRPPAVQEAVMPVQGEYGYQEPVIY